MAGNLVNNNGVTNTFNSANQLISSGADTFEYDNNGNLWKTNGAVSHTWDRANRLLSHGGLSYAYDGMGNRVSQDNGTDVTNYLLDTQPGLTKVLGDSDGNRYMHNARGIHAMYDGADWSYAVRDGLGSVRMEVGATVSASQNYTPYGEVMDINGSFDTPFGFTGEQTDSNGQVYLRARYYNPSMGGFLSLDPFEGVLDIPMSLNGYEYVHSNPVNNTDPSGFSCLLTSYVGLQERRDTLLEIARRWNNISDADCSQLTGIDILNECGGIRETKCSTGFSDEAFATLMASILAQEARFRGRVAGGNIFENLFGSIIGFAQSQGAYGMGAAQNIVAYIWGGRSGFSRFNTTEGASQIRSTVLEEILKGIVEGSDGTQIMIFDTSRLDAIQDWLQRSDEIISGYPIFAPEAVTFARDTNFLNDERISLELLAANLYRGILRIKSERLRDVPSEPTVFNLASWHNEGVQGAMRPDNSGRTYNPKATNYANDVLGYMIEFVEGECDLGFSTKPRVWVDFMYYNQVDADFLRQPVPSHTPRSQ